MNTEQSIAAESLAMKRAAVSAILNCKGVPTYAKAKRKVPGLTQAEYALALALVRK
jgi:hypothetical protein